MKTRSYLIIPDGLRRYARKNSLELVRNYKTGGERLFELGDYLLQEMSFVGLFPLAKYNFNRNNQEVKAIMEGLLHSIELYRSTSNFSDKICVIGDIKYLEQRDSRFKSVLNGLKINPHLDQDPYLGQFRIFLYLCYDWPKYFKEIFTINKGVRFDRKFVKWDYALRTGCSNGVYRFSGLFPGTDQTLCYGSKSLFQDFSKDELTRWT